MASVTIEIHVLAEHLTMGEWCPTCSLPSAVRLPFVGVDPTSLRVVLRAATFACQDCGRHWNVDSDRQPEAANVDVQIVMDDD